MAQESTSVRKPGIPSGRGKGESPTSPRLIESAERRRQALELRKAGLTLEGIARQLGFASVGAVHQTLDTAMREIIKEPAEALLQIELERLEALQLALWPKARAGDLASIDRVLKVMERRTKFLGLDAPLKTAVSIQAREMQAALDLLKDAGGQEALDVAMAGLLPGMDAVLGEDVEGDAEGPAEEGPDATQGDVGADAA